MTDLPIGLLQQENRQNFLNYNEYSKIADIVQEFPEKGIMETIGVYEGQQTLKNELQDSLNSRIDKNELIAISAIQVGIPIHAVYFEYQNITRLLMEPSLSVIEGSKPSLFLKLIKCPNSPLPYYIGICNKNIRISSSNNKKDIVLELDHKDPIDPLGTLSANLQKAIWADKGYIPGDAIELPMSYSNVCKLFNKETSKLHESFNCTIHRQELEKIIEALEIVDISGAYMSTVNTIKFNLLTLLANNITTEWIPVPPVDLFSKQSSLNLS